jgi:hypothetical protein
MALARDRLREIWSMEAWWVSSDLVNVVAILSTLTASTPTKRQKITLNIILDIQAYLGIVYVNRVLEIFEGKSQKGVLQS